MSTNFPSSLDSYSDKVDNTDDVMAADINNLQDAIEALEARVGVSSSAVTTSLFYNMIPSSTKMLFYADSAPTGWTIDTTMNDKLVFVTKGSGASGQTGGGAHSTGSWTISGITVDSHQHAVPVDFATGGAIRFNHTCEYGTDGGSHVITRQSTAVVASASVAFAYSGLASDNGTTSSGAWRPAAYCYICCSKNAFT